LEDLSKLQNVKIIFVCGKNVKLCHDIKNLNYPNVIPLKFYQPMDELYAIADVFVGKPGGLSTAESLRWNLPLVVCYTLPGQEERNLKYLVERKLVIIGKRDLLSSVGKELKTGEFRESLKQNSERQKVFQEGQALILAVKEVLEVLK
jgi:processive 1,2-diacylglycerol beta-glucosyltransferase